MIRRSVAAFMVVMMALGVLVAPAAAYEFPSTNEENMANGGPYVHMIASGPGWIELEFVDPQGIAKFELRADGAWPDGRTCREHQVIENECTYPGWEVEETDGTESGIFGWNDGWLEPHHTMEVRKAGGAERDTDFDWVTFQIPPVENPVQKADCLDGGYGWQAFGFKNQGQCIRYVNTGKDSRS